MLSRSQQILLKRAQRAAALPDDEYRDALEVATGCRSSRDREFNDRGLDKFQAFLEAIYFRKLDAGELQPAGSAFAVFRRRGYWAGKNTNHQTSRDRFTGLNLNQVISDLERRLAAIGFGREYCEGIRNKSAQGRTDAHGQHLYLAALRRTVAAKSKTCLRVTAPLFANFPE